MTKTLQHNIDLYEEVMKDIARSNDDSLANYLTWLQIDSMEKASVIINIRNFNEILASGKVKTVRDTMGYCLSKRMTVLNFSYSDNKKNHFYFEVVMGETK